MDLFWWILMVLSFIAYVMTLAMVSSILKGNK